MRKRWALLGIIAASVAVIARWQLARLFSETPEYSVEDRVGDLEIRRYGQRVVAETLVEHAGWDEALNEGFRRLAGYIFGDNRSRSKISMTSPVGAKPERIAMTSPVNAGSAKNGSLWITFTMPRGSSIDQLPVPNDPRVELRTAPPHRVAALRFRGRYNGENVARAFDHLRNEVRRAGLDGDGEPQFAGYDPPTTLPLLRRNEVWVRLSTAAAE